MSSSKHNYQTDSPVLILLFNRPKETLRLIKSLQIVRPNKVYINIDGPRENSVDDNQRVRKVKKIIKDNINWTSEIFINTLEKNYGCGDGPRVGINWFFKNEEYGIILEDDCIPGESFFRFCDSLLRKYADDKKIWLISGDNGGPIISAKHFKESDFLFTRIPLIWGWATWRDRWIKYDEDLELWKKGVLKNYNKLNHVKFFEKFIVSRVSKLASKAENKNFWDFQLYSTMLQNQGYGIIPKNNLISNIGWGDIATHTKKENNRSFSNIVEEELILETKEISSSKRINSLITYNVHTNVTDRYINTENLSLLRVGYIVSRATYYIKYLFNVIFK